MRRRRSAKREHESLRAHVDDLYLEPSVGDQLRLPDQLIQSLYCNHAVALLVNVNAVSKARRRPVESHAESHGRSTRRWPHDEIKVARVEVDHKREGESIRR
jgi:hypothetical protein